MSKSDFIFPLTFHEPNFSEFDLLINPKLFPFAKIGTLMHIFSKENPLKRLLLKVKSVEETKGNLKISVSKYIGNKFNFVHMENVWQTFSSMNNNWDIIFLIFHVAGMCGGS